MGRPYNFRGNGNMTAAGDILEVQVPADMCLVLHQAVITQSTEAGDTESEQMRFKIYRVTGSPTSGSGGVAVAPRLLRAGDAATSLVGEFFNTTDLSGGTQTVIWDESVNVMQGFNYQPAPDERPEFGGQTYLLVRLETTPTDSITFILNIVAEEIG